MKVVSKRTRLTPMEIIKKAEDYFDGRFGLKKTDSDSSCCADFVGDLGFVSVRVEASDGSNEAVLTTREFDYQVQDFLKRL